MLYSFFQQFTLSTVQAVTDSQVRRCCKKNAIKGHILEQSLACAMCIEIEPVAWIVLRQGELKSSLPCAFYSVEGFSGHVLNLGFVYQNRSKNRKHSHCPVV